MTGVQTCALPICSETDPSPTPSGPTTHAEVMRVIRLVEEDRIEVDDVGVTVDEADRSLLYVDIRYHIKKTNDPRNLVFPFYTIPPEH